MASTDDGALPRKTRASSPGAPAQDAKENKEEAATAKIANKEERASPVHPGGGNRSLLLGVIIGIVVAVGTSFALQQFNHQAASTTIATTVTTTESVSEEEEDDDDDEDGGFNFKVGSMMKMMGMNSSDLDDEDEMDKTMRAIEKDRAKEKKAKAKKAKAKKGPVSFVDDMSKRLSKMSLQTLILVYAVVIGAFGVAGYSASLKPVQVKVPAKED